MIKKTITYDDYNDVEVTEDFYFNLNKLELMEMEISHKGGLQAHIEELTEAEAGPEVYFLFKDIILKSFGRKSEDGRGFKKSEDISKSFEESRALGEMIFGFLSSGDEAAQFVNGIFPAKMVKEAADAKKAQESKSGTVAQLPTADPVLAPAKTNEEPTDEELLKMKPNEMSKEQLLRAFQLKNQQ